ncbi:MULTISPECIES: hypothetical protein [Aerosakkonema]|uniref:hypothetical protein n=1 Tax=Aerosakkonema TaxID=1246629 RepID=UPI0035B8FE3D
MKNTSSVTVIPYLTAELGSAYKYGMPPASDTSPVNVAKASANAQYSVKPDPLAIVGSISTNNNSMPSEVTANNPSIQTAQNSDFSPIIQFFVKSITNPLPVVFGSSVALVIIAMLISQISGGIRVKLDLEVSPTYSQGEKTTAVKQ